MKKLLTLCLLSVNVMAASSEAPEGSRGAAGGAGRSVDVIVTAESIEAMSCAFDDVIRKRNLTTWPIQDILKERPRPRSNSSFSRLGEPNPEARKYFMIDKKLENGGRQLGLKYFELEEEREDLYADIEELHKKITDLQKKLAKK